MHGIKKDAISSDGFNHRSQCLCICDNGRAVVGKSAPISTEITERLGTAFAAGSSAADAQAPNIVETAIDKEERTLAKTDARSLAVS